jgi:predicted SAM-dependent methyltransferase
MIRHLGPEAANNLQRRLREGFFDKYLSGDTILDIGYRGGDPNSEPITDKAIGIELDYPGYDGKTLPFREASQDAVFASHVLEHIKDWAAALADWYRVLKVRGFMVIAVPHRDLYERKATPPSRFNPDHKRFYTPASLLREVEETLPAGGYRIRLLKDVDEGFDYTIPPERHAAGSYEIELVIEKIEIPEYADTLRPSPAADDVVACYAALVQKAIRAHQGGRPSDVCHIQAVLSRLPLPLFPVLAQELREMRSGMESDDALLQEVRWVMEPVLQRVPFDEEWYFKAYPDVAKAALADPNVSSQNHFVRHGYFEGRAPGASDPIFE